MNRWLMAALFLAALAAPAQADPVLRWAPADTTIALGDAVTLSVVLDEPLPVRTIELYVSYDADLVTTVSGGPGVLFDGFNLFQGFVEVHPESPGLWHGYCVILGWDDWTTGPGELFRWTVRGDVEGVCAIATYDLTLLPPGGGSYPGAILGPTTLIIGEDLTAAPLAGDSGPWLRLQPNPFNPATQVSFDLGADVRGSLEVLDALGRRVFSLPTSDDRAGSWTWRGLDATGHALPSGVYNFVLTGQDGRRAVTRGTLLR